MAKAPKSETEKSIASMDKIRFADGPTSVAELRLKLQKEMQDHAAVYRTQASLEEGVVRDKRNLVPFPAPWYIGGAEKVSERAGGGVRV